MRILGDWEDTFVLLCHQTDTVIFKPLIGIAVVEGLKESFHQPMSTGIDL